MNVLVVCHTEFGRVLPNHKLVFSKDPVGATQGVLNLYGVMWKYGAKVTLAVCPEVAQYVPIPNNAPVEVGLHIHPGWEEFSVDGNSYYAGDTFLRRHVKQSSTSSILPAYSYEEQSEMIDVGTNRIIEVLGQIPRSFVAGRWSVNNNTIKALIKNGITRDCSAQASHKTDHYDWSQLPRISMPYTPASDDYQRQGGLPIVEIPISQVFGGMHATPEDRRSSGFKWFQLTFEEYYRRHCPVFHMCFHSPAMTDEYYLDRLDTVLNFIVGHKDVEFKYASEIMP